MAEEDIHSTESSVSTIPKQDAPVTYGATAFVMNVASMPDVREAVITEGLLLRKASTSEVQKIKDFLLKGANSHNPIWPWIWEHRQVEGEDSSLRMEPLRPEEYRYFVLETDNIHNNLISQLELVQSFSRIKFLIGITFYNFLGGGFGFHPEQLLQTQLKQYPIWKFYDLTTADLDCVRKEFEIFSKHQNEVFDIARVANRLIELQRIPDNSDLKFLGYFALLESMLAHEPQQTDPYSSITRQVTTKLALLRNRIQDRQDIPQFAGIPHDKLWKKMYAYRSKIAHGSRTETDFSEGLRLLVSPEDAFDLLRETVNQVATHSLVEGQLMADLRKC